MAQRQSQRTATRTAPTAWRSNGVAKKKYLVGGMLRPAVKQISDAMSKTRLSAGHPPARAGLLLQRLRTRLSGDFRQRHLPPPRHGPPAKHGPDRQQKGTGARAQHRLRRQVTHSGTDRGWRARCRARPADDERRRRRHGRYLPRPHSPASPQKFATRSAFSKGSAKKASTAFSFPAASPAPKPSCRR